MILSVDAENAEDGMIRLQLEVRDTGSGIEPEVQKVAKDKLER